MNRRMSASLPVECLDSEEESQTTQQPAGSQRIECVCMFVCMCVCVWCVRALVRVLPKADIIALGTTESCIENSPRTHSPSLSLLAHSLSIAMPLFQVHVQCVDVDVQTYVLQHGYATCLGNELRFAFVVLIDERKLPKKVCRCTRAAAQCL